MPTTTQVMHQMGASQAQHQARLYQQSRHQRRKTSMDPYYSRLFWIPVLTGAGPYVYTIAAGTTVRGFGYAQNNDMTAGGQPGVSATEADTNIITPGKTIGGRAVVIQGISVQVGPKTATASLAAALFAETTVRLLFNGSETNILLGDMFMWPGASSLYGNGQNINAIGAIPGGPNPYGFFSNGLPGVDNKKRIREGVVWQPEGEADSTLVVQFGTQRAVTATAAADEAAAAGVRGFTHPTAAAMTVDCMLELHGYVVGPRSHIV
jgi:hypothetical protein